MELAGLIASCFLLCIVGAVIPWVNSEAIVLSFAALTKDRTGLVLIAAAAAVGQMVGKSAMYLAGRGAPKLGSPRMVARVERWRSRLASRRALAWLITFASASTGLPPFYIVSVLAGTFGVGFAGFVVVGTVGRFARFVALAFTPGLVSSWWR